jgi:signal peptidase II
VKRDLRPLWAAVAVLIVDHLTKWATVRYFFPRVPDSLMSDGVRNWIASANPSGPLLAPTGPEYLIGTAVPQNIIDSQLLLWLLSNHPREPVTVIPHCFHFRYAENTGAAFSIFAENPIILTLLSTAALIGIFWWFWITPRTERLMRLCQGAIIGGALGNLIDRWTRGFVVDFIDWHWKDVYHWPTFNIADSAIFVSVCVLSAYLIFWAKPHDEEKTNNEDSGDGENQSKAKKKKNPKIRAKNKARSSG